MISVSRKFHSWCGLIQPQDTPHNTGSSPHLSSTEARVSAVNHAYLAIVTRYQLNLGDTTGLREQIGSIILSWKACWFAADRGDKERDGCIEEEILVEVLHTLISRDSSLSFSGASRNELSKEVVVTALALVS